MKVVYDLQHEGVIPSIPPVCSEMQQPNAADLASLLKRIVQCRDGRKKQTCADCRDFPCGDMMEFPLCPDMGDGLVPAKALRLLLHGDRGSKQGSGEGQETMNVNIPQRVH